MKLFESINNSKGITLNSQIVDLLSIIDNEGLTREEQDKQIIEYIAKLKSTVDKRDEYIIQFGDGIGKFKFLIDSLVDEIPDNLTQLQREEIKRIYMSSIENFDIYDTDVMKGKLSESNLSENIADYMLTNIKDNDYEAKEGILELTPDKVRALHRLMFENGNKFDFINVDNAGKYSCYVSFDGKTFTPNRLDKMFDFARRHGMGVKINTFMFYADFPKMYEQYCLSKYNSLSEEEKTKAMRASIKKTLFDYVQNVCERYGDDIHAIDVLNEVIYDPNMIEKEYRDSEEASYHQRTGQWMKYLSVDDLAELILMTRKLLPNTRLLYNDVNWVNPDKRREIIAFVKLLQEKEREFRVTGKLNPDERGLIDTIGLEAHLDTSVRLSQLDETLRDIEAEIGLPVEITELDIARTGKNPLSEAEILKQQKILARIYKIANQRINGNSRIGAIAMWSQSDDMCFVDKHCNRKVYGSVLDSNFEEKEFEPEKRKQYQQFDYHTHTPLCGHADGEIKEYVEKAIEAGLDTIGFSDHNPPPFGKNDFKSSMSIEQFAEEYIPTLKALKEEYADKIRIMIGLEVEYYGDEGEQNETIKAYREKVESELDYMILGQHFVVARDNQGKLMSPVRKSDPISASYPLDYAYTVVEAIKTAKFAYIAHPDIFLQYRDKVSDDQRDEYNKNVKIATEMICEVAARYKVPLEINLGEIAGVRAEIPGKELRKDGNYSYPVPEFWKIAEEKGCDVLIGIDAHNPEALIDRTNGEIAKELIEKAGIKLHYLDFFEPLGIGKELNRMSRGKMLLNQVLELGDDIRNGEIIEETGKILRKQKDLVSEKSTEEQL